MTENKNGTTNHIMMVIAILLTVMIFAVDIQVELGVAVGVSYVAVVLLGLWIPQQRFIPVVVLACSVLVVLGFYKSPPLTTGEMWKVVSNRGLSLFVIWLTGILCLMQKRDTQALSDSEAYTRSIVESMYDSLIVIDETGIVLTLNAAAKRCFGYSAGELVGKNVSLLMPEPVRSQHDFYLKRYLETGKSTIMGSGRRVVGLRKDGTSFPMDLFLGTTTQKGRPVFIGTIRDVTERVQAEEALRESETRYHTQFNQLCHIMKGTTHATGKEFLRSLVYNLATALETRCVFVAEIIDERSKVMTIRALWALGRGDDAAFPLEYPLKGSPCEHIVERKEMIYLPKDVHKIYPSLASRLGMEMESYMGYPLFDLNGKIVGVLAVMHDKPISNLLNIQIIMPIFVARAEVEMARERGEQQIQVLFAAVEQSPSSVVITDATGSITYVNPSLTRTTGYTLEELIGANPRLWKSDKHPPEFYSQLWDTILAGKEWRSDICNKKKNGELYWELLSVLPIKNSKGDITHFISTKVDDTERRHAEARLKHYAGELKRSNQALDEFAVIASHDLQEPLRKVTVFGECLRTHIDDKGLDYLERVQKATVRMQRFITDLLAYSQIAAKPCVFKPTDLREVISGVLSDLEVRIAQSKAKVDVGSLPTIDADELQMRQLFQNLIVNALKFQKKDEPPVVGINGHCSNGLWTITVEDNGVGFDEKYAERIFKPFERLHGKSEYEGSGIGLAVCRKVVQRHGGDITVRSVPEKGTKFHVTLPEKQDDLAASPE